MRTAKDQVVISNAARARQTVTNPETKATYEFIPITILWRDK